MPIPQAAIDTLIASYENYGIVSRKDTPNMSTKLYAQEVYEAILESHTHAVKQVFKDANGEYTPVIYDPNIYNEDDIRAAVRNWTE